MTTDHLAEAATPAAAPEYDAPLRLCPLCGGGRLRAFDRDHRGHRIDRCKDCRIKLMNPQYTDGDRARFYQSYISFHEVKSSKNRVSMHRWPWVREAAKRRSLELLARYGTRGRLLCIGCGDGVEIGIAKQLGWDADGYDVDPDVTAEVARKYGVVTHSGDFFSIAAADGSYDAVFMDQVLEHLKNPGDYLRKVNALLRPGGVLFLGLPNIGSVANRLKTLAGKLGLRWRRRGSHYATKHHLFYFAPRPTRALLERRFGFEVLRLSGSLKPQKKLLTPILSRWLPSVDSGFFAVARKVGRGAAG